ncbi:VOC family protein [Robiginitalea sp. SC105]|uniref:VOC family protein n=1 Tax=Robiginitalea sp. SC105 TaxID=2762332 RepID=UPI001639BF84|nr:VOC family protein [Robiginitalea sp. SC105]MBC2838489.1 VOC family protein [Robiginitalea sp. SC105]
MEKASFHLSLPCRSISATRAFYVDILGAKAGRQSSQWVDIDLYGNQITFTKTGPFNFQYQSYKFEDSVLPAFHFGVLVSGPELEELLHRLEGLSLELPVNTLFLQDKPGAHRSFFVEDPNGFMVEFKNFLNPGDVFRTE